MIVDSGLKKDPDNEGWVLGWAVRRLSPWELVGIYKSEDMAVKKAMMMGPGFKAKFGSYRLGSDDFVSIHTLK